jgi:hypothetical protein
MTSVRVRMYRQGLGDCFLLTFGGQQGDRHVLIDCGVLTGTEDAQQRMRKVAQNISDTTGKRLDVLVATHEHWDHLSGFLQAEDIFDELTVREIWLAWTEKPGDKIAGELADRRARTLRAIMAAARQLKAVESLGARRTAARLDALLEFTGTFGVEGRKTTTKALEWVKNRTGASIRYCLPGDEPFSVPDVEGVRVYVLGPPRDLKRLRKSDPSKKSSEVYELAGEGGVDLGFLAAVDPSESGADADAEPFAEWFRLSDEESKSRPFFADYYWGNGDWRTIEHDWLDTAGQLALRLDSDTNNTSLVLAFEAVSSGRVLLFPGDAQVGNWLSWADLTWTVPDGRGGSKTVRIHDLLARTVLYKVGHHGSHNGTLRDRGLELMTSDELVAMMPVSRDTAKKRDWKMPLSSLFARLRDRTRGRVIDRDQGVTGVNRAELSERERKEWDRFVAHTDVHEEWIDYRLEF